MMKASKIIALCASSLLLVACNSAVPSSATQTTNTEPVKFIDNGVWQLGDNEKFVIYPSNSSFSGKSYTITITDTYIYVHNSSGHSYIFSREGTTWYYFF